MGLLQLLLLLPCATSLPLVLGYCLCPLDSLEQESPPFHPASRSDPCLWMSEHVPQDGKVLGCQAVGEAEGVEKRVDVIAAFMQMGGTVYDLAEAELCYGEPWSSEARNL